MKLKIEIKHWITGAVLFAYETEDNSLKKTLEEASLEGASLRGANLQGASLRRANLQEADLWGADLRRANLEGADLEGADLWGADLWGANLEGADLEGADLRGANLWGANLLGTTNIPNDMTNFWWHVHHEVLVEQLTEPLRARINYIKANKPKSEIELRLRLLKPVLGKIPTTTEKGWERLHKKECQNCPWNGETIFPEKKGSL